MKSSTSKKKNRRERTVLQWAFTIPVLSLVVFCSGCVGMKIKQKVNRAPKTKEAWTGIATDVDSKSNFTAVSFGSLPQGVSVFVGDSLIGTTPVSIRFPHKVDIEQQSLVTYREELHWKNSSSLGPAVIDGVFGAFTAGATAIADVGTMAHYRSKGDIITGSKGIVFPEKVLSNTPTGEFREIVRPDERRIEFRFEDLVGKKTLHLPEESKVEFNFGELRLAKIVKCALRLQAEDANVSVVLPNNASVEQSGRNIWVSVAGLEQDGIGKWWFNGQELENFKLPVKLARATGQWTPPVEPIMVALPQRYTAGPVNVEVDVPLKAIPWFWTRHADWPAVDGAAITEEQRESWKSKLNNLWSTREDNKTNLYAAVFSGLLLRALSNTNEDTLFQNKLASFVHGIAARKINVAFKNFRKIDPATDTALSFEIQEDTIRGLREAGSAYFMFTDASTSPTSTNSTPLTPDYLMLVDLVNIVTDTQERIARSAGKVQIGARKHANPEYYDLLKTRVASEQMLARISSGGIEADSQAQKQEGDAMARLLVGGALAHNNALTPADSGGILLGVMGSLFGADADQKKSQAYQAQLAQAQSAVNELSQKLSSMTEYTEEPIYQEFHTEDRYVVKKALATAYVKLVAPTSETSELFSRKLISDVTVSDTSEEANPATGKKGHALDLPSDQQMKRDVSSKLTEELTRQIREGFLARLGLEYYARAKVAENNGDVERFADNAIPFLLSPAAKAYPNQAHDILVLLDGLVKRATRSTKSLDFDKLLGSN